MKALAICAHSDDVEIYCLGLLLALQAQGAEISWAIATDSFVQGDNCVLCDHWTRRREALTAAALCGVEPVFLGEQDGLLRLDRKLATKIATLVEEQAADIVITHSEQDYHRDHRALSRAVLDTVSRLAPVLVADSYYGVGFSPPGVRFLLEIEDVDSMPALAQENSPDIRVQAGSLASLASSSLAG